MAPTPPDPLAVAEERILGGGPRLTPTEIWARSGVPESLAQRLWLAMGFPHVPEGDPVLTDRDLRALQRAGELLADGAFDAEHLVQQTRVMSQALSTIAVSHIESLSSPGGGHSLLSGLTDGSADPMPLLDELLSYLYRRHLFAALERATLSSDAEPYAATALSATTVGFADLTDFSAAAAAVSEEELTVLLDDFAALSADLVASAGGRVVKLIGDEVMFSVNDPRRAADLALDLVLYGQAPEVPDVHVGMAYGPVLGHHGDLFGSTVNIASRLSDVARPGTVLVDGGLAEALAGESDLTLRPVRLRPLKGIGPVPAFKLRR